MAEASRAAHDYDVAISYAGEDRLYVHEFVQCLKARELRVFYDLDEEVALWGADLPEVLLDIFQKQARVAVIFISEHYVKKPWAMHEGRTVIGRAISEHGTYLLPVRIDDTELPGLRQEIVFQRTESKSPSDLADLLVLKLGRIPDLSRKDVTLDAPSSAPEDRSADAALAKAVADGEPLYLVMDLGGTKAYVALMSRDAEMLYAKRFLTESHNDPNRLLAFIRQCIRVPLDHIHELTGLKPQQVEGKITAIGIAFPGPTDFGKGLVLDASNFQIKNFPLVERLRETFDVPTYMDNDVNLAARGEAWKGAARNYDNVVGIMIGTGIGGGLIINGEVHRGRNRTAGEIGHMVIDLDSNVECGCGQFGCFEALASRKAMARELHQRKATQGFTDSLWDEDTLMSNEIAEHYKAGDLDALAVVTRAAEFCGKAVFTLLNLLNPEIIVFNGGFVFQLGERFLEPIRLEAAKCMNAVYSVGENKIPIVLGELSNPVLYGACRMAMQGGGGKLEQGRHEILAEVEDGLQPHHYQVLAELQRLDRPAPLSGNSRSSYHEDNIRPLRDRGLVRLDAQSFRQSKTIDITALGRILVERGH